MNSPRNIPLQRIPSFGPQRPQAITPLGAALVLGLAALAATTHPRAAQAASQYCTFSVPCGLSAGFVSNSSTYDDTYFWSPSTAPVAPASVTISAPLKPLASVRQLTLRGNNIISVFGNAAQSNVLIGSLGNDRLNGNGGGDYYIIGGGTAAITNLPSCTSGSVSDCIQSSAPGTAVESDQVTLNAGRDVIWIDRCLQSTANFAISASLYARGGDQINAASTVPAAPLPGRAMPAIPPATACVAGVADSRGPLHAFPAMARLLPEPMRWPQSWQALWQQSSRWLQSALASLSLTSPARAWPLAWGKPCQSQCPIPGIARILQSPGSSFGGAEGDRILLDQASLTFNNAPLPEGKKTVSLQPRVKAPIPLGKGIALVYHQELALLARYGNDRAPYGTPENPGTVIAQLVDRAGRPLSAASGTLNRATLNWVEVVAVKALPPAPRQPAAPQDRPGALVPDRR